MAAPWWLRGSPPHFWNDLRAATASVRGERCRLSGMARACRCSSPGYPKTLPQRCPQTVLILLRAAGIDPPGDRCLMRSASSVTWMYANGAGYQRADLPVSIDDGDVVTAVRSGSPGSSACRDSPGTRCHRLGPRSGTGPPSIATATACANRVAQPDHANRVAQPDHEGLERVPGIESDAALSERPT